MSGDTVPACDSDRCDGALWLLLLKCGSGFQRIRHEELALAPSRQEASVLWQLGALKYPLWAEPNESEVTQLQLMTSGSPVSDVQWIGAKPSLNWGSPWAQGCEGVWLLYNCIYTEGINWSRDAQMVESGSNTLRACLCRKSAIMQQCNVLRHLTVIVIEKNVTLMHCNN